MYGAQTHGVSGLATLSETNSVPCINVFNRNVVLETEMAMTKRSFLAGVTATLAVAALASPALARDIWVEGKYRRDGVYVPGHYRTGRDPSPIDDTKPYRVPNDERSRVEPYDGNNSFGRNDLFGRGNKGGNARGRRLGD